jgi:hypothetical protein
MVLMEREFRRVLAVAREGYFEWIVAVAGEPAR